VKVHPFIGTEKAQATALPVPAAPKRDDQHSNLSAEADPAPNLHDSRKWCYRHFMAGQELAASTDVPRLTLPDDLEPDRWADEVSRQLGGHWLGRDNDGYVVWQLQDVRAILGDTRWHQALGLPLDAMPDRSVPLVNRQRTSLLSSEGDEHRRLRRIVSNAFTRRSSREFEGTMREIMLGLLPQVLRAGRCDAMSEICEPYTGQLFCSQLGIERTDWSLVITLMNDLSLLFNRQLQPVLRQVLQAQRRVDVYLTQLIAECRENPREGLLSELLRAEDAGDFLDAEEVRMMIQGLLSAGTLTTAGAFGAALIYLSHEPELWSSIATDDDVRAQVCEEAVRVSTPVKVTGRFATEDIEYRGFTFPKGSVVNLLLNAASADPAHFSSGYFDSALPDIKDHVGFGLGIHYCIGANMARLALSTALQVMATEIGELRLAGVPTWHGVGSRSGGPKTIPIELR
jgi:cytochrome P450